MSPLEVVGISCPKCEGSEVKRDGFFTYSDGSRVQRYFCEECSSSFPAQYRVAATKPALEACPKCGSSHTVKVGKLVDVSHGTVQPCKCKDCGRQFLLGRRKLLQVFFKGKKIYSCWNPPGLRPMPDVACPACMEQKAFLKTERKHGPEKGRRIMVCFGCGRQFNAGANWNAQVRRKLGEEVPLLPWRFFDDTWDLREFYPSLKEQKHGRLFLHFKNCGDSWFKELVKGYILWCMHRGLSISSLHHFIGSLGGFGRFLCQQSVSSMNDLNRQVLGIYWTQERGHLSRSTLNNHIGRLKDFLDWGNSEKHFITASTLITSFEKPKVFNDEPDPLEDSVLKAIRDNLTVLPQPLQLMFILGFWLGTRPSELCHLRKDCLKLDPDGTTWWLEFRRQKTKDEHRLPITTDLVRLIQQQQDYITKLHGIEYAYLFCHYQGFWKSDYPEYLQLKAVRHPPLTEASQNPMVKAIRHLIEQCNIHDSNGQLVKFTGAILRPSRATQLIRDGESLEFVRIWLKHRSVKTTKQHYTRYRPGELLDVACVMANMDAKFIPYESHPSSLRQNPEQHELDGLKMPGGEPLYGYCTFREFCPRFGRCYTCGFHIASADKLPHYKAQLEGLLAKETEVFNYGSAEMLKSYTEIVNALVGKIAALEAVA